MDIPAQATALVMRCLRCVAASHFVRWCWHISSARKSHTTPTTQTTHGARFGAPLGDSMPHRKLDAYRADNENMNVIVVVVAIQLSTRTAERTGNARSRRQTEHTYYSTYTYVDMCACRNKCRRISLSPSYIFGDPFAKRNTRDACIKWSSEANTHTLRKKSHTHIHWSQLVGQLSAAGRPDKQQQ